MTIPETKHREPNQSMPEGCGSGEKLGMLRSKRKHAESLNGGPGEEAARAVDR